MKAAGQARRRSAIVLARLGQVGDHAAGGQQAVVAAVQLAEEVMAARLRAEQGPRSGACRRGGSRGRSAPRSPRPRRRWAASRMRSENFTS